MPHSPIANPLESADPTPDPDGWRGAGPGSARPDQGRQPPGQDTSGPIGLGALRAELDRIDDGLHALLQERASVVEQVARSGKPAAFRPGREAAIIRRLLAQHTGKLPPLTLCRIWRELMAGTTAMQGRFVVAVGAPGEPVELAREHFGALTPLRAETSPELALRAVEDGSASVAILPLPTEADPWWASLGAARGLFVVAKLPFWATRPEGAATSQALVIAATPPDPSGDDRSLLVLEVEAGVDKARLAEALRVASLPPEAMIIAGPSNGRARVLAQVAALTAEDPRLAAAGPWLRPPVVVGGFAAPIDAAR